MPALQPVRRALRVRGGGGTEGATSSQESGHAVTPPIVSHRNHMQSMEDHVDRACAYLRAGKVDDAMVATIRPIISRALRDYTDAVAADFASAASRGIKQAGELIRDPLYYQKKQAYRKRRLKDSIEQRQRRRQESEMAPPASVDELEQERNRLIRDEWWHTEMKLPIRVKGTGLTQ